VSLPVDLFLPIARTEASVPLMVGVGGVVGLLSGLFGVGGGFLLTPLLMLLGITPMVAAGSSSAMIVASSTTGVLEHSRGHTVDYKMGFTLFGGGVVGSVLGVRLLQDLNRFGPANSLIRVLYVVILGAIGSFMLVESIRTWRHGHYLAERRFAPIPRRRWLDALPLRMRFPRSEIEVSFMVPAVLGALSGTLAALMGVSGGFIMIPLMLYVLRMRMHVVAGTGLLQNLCTCVLVTILQARENRTVDVVLAILLATGATVATIVGTRVGRRLRADQLKILLALIVIGVATGVTMNLVRTPRVLLSYVAGE
jgi:uncharacterized membrane protein YfcA